MSSLALTVHPELATANHALQNQPSSLVVPLKVLLENVLRDEAAVFLCLVQDAHLVEAHLSRHRLDQISARVERDHREPRA